MIMQNNSAIAPTCTIGTRSMIVTFHDGMLKVGDRVRREKTIGGRDWRAGTVTECYHSLKSTTTSTVAQFAVRWDDSGQVERGYLRGGLINE